MKYIIYGLLMLSGYGLTYGLFPLVMPTRLALDIVLILLICTAQVTKDYTAFVIGLCMGLVIDIFVSPAFGLATLTLGIFGYCYAKMSAKMGRDSFVTAIIAVIVFYLMRDCGYMLYGLVYGTRFPFVTMLWKMSLPSALLNGAVAFPLYLLTVKLHELHSMKARRELDFLRSYQEQTDWLTSWFEQYK